VTKFVKYLPEFGWRCSVLTVSNPSVPLLDESLLADVPPSTIVRKAKTLEPGYALKNAVSASSKAGGNQPGILKQFVKGTLRRFSNLVLQPDPQILWRRHALKEGLRLLNELPHDVIVATGPPFSSLMLGATLAEKTGVPLVLDYRDEWGISNKYWENKQQGRLANWAQQRMEHRAARSANVLLATTPSSAEAVAEVGRAAGSQALATHIYNGFDPCDFDRFDSESLAKVDYGNGTKKFRIAFIGTLWALNSIQPFVEAIEQLTRTAPQLAEELEIVFAGRRTADQELLVDRMESLPCSVVRLPFVSHDDAIRLMRTADSLLLLNANVPHAHRIIGAKTYEYMAARRPMFVIAPRGDVWDIVKDLPGSVLCEPSQVDVIAECLALQIEQHRCGATLDAGIWNIDRFTRRNLTGELATLLDRVIESVATSRHVTAEAESAPRV